MNPVPTKLNKMKILSTIVLLPRVDHHTPSDVDLPLRRVVLQLPQYLLLSRVPLHAANVGFAAHEVGVQLRLGDEEVELALLAFCLWWEQPLSLI